MGAHQSQHAHVNNFDPNQWQFLQHNGDVRVLLNRYNPRQLVQEYPVSISNQRQLQLAQELYNFRLSDNELVSANFLNVHRQKQLCSKSYAADLYTQRIPIRLSNIVHVPYPDVLHLYQQCFNGFSRLSRRLGYFRVNQQCVGVNQNHVAKVWHSANFSEIEPHYRVNSQQQMVRNIIEMIQNNTDPASMPRQQPSFSSFVYRDHDQVGFGQAKYKLEMYANMFNRGYIPNHLFCVEKAGGAVAIRNKWNQTNSTTYHQPLYNSQLRRSYLPTSTVVQPYVGPVQTVNYVEPNRLSRSDILFSSIPSVPVANNLVSSQTGQFYKSHTFAPQPQLNSRVVHPVHNSVLLSPNASTYNAPTSQIVYNQTPRHNSIYYNQQRSNITFRRPAVHKPLSNVVGVRRYDQKPQATSLLSRQEYRNGYHTTSTPNINTLYYNNTVNVATRQNFVPQTPVVSYGYGQNKVSQNRITFNPVSQTNSALVNVTTAVDKTGPLVGANTILNATQSSKSLNNFSAPKTQQIVNQNLPKIQINTVPSQPQVKIQTQNQVNQVNQVNQPIQGTQVTQVNQVNQTQSHATQRLNHLSQAIGQPTQNITQTAQKNQGQINQGVKVYTQANQQVTQTNYNQGAKVQSTNQVNQQVNQQINQQVNHNHLNQGLNYVGQLFEQNLVKPQSNYNNQVQTNQVNQQVRQQNNLNQGLNYVGQLFEQNLIKPQPSSVNQGANFVFNQQFNQTNSLRQGLNYVGQLFDQNLIKPQPNQQQTTTNQQSNQQNNLSYGVNLVGQLFQQNLIQPQPNYLNQGVNLVGQVFSQTYQQNQNIQSNQQNNVNQQQQVQTQQQTQQNNIASQHQANKLLIQNFNLQQQQQVPQNVPGQYQFIPTVKNQTTQNQTQVQNRVQTVSDNRNVQQFQQNQQISTNNVNINLAAQNQAQLHAVLQTQAQQNRFVPSAQNQIVPLPPNQLVLIPQNQVAVASRNQVAVVSQNQVVPLPSNQVARTAQNQVSVAATKQVYSSQQQTTYDSLQRSQQNRPTQQVQNIQPTITQDNSQYKPKLTQIQKADSRYEPNYRSHNAQQYVESGYNGYNQRQQNIQVQVQDNTNNNNYEGGYYESKQTPYDYDFNSKKVNSTNQYSLSSQYKPSINKLSQKYIHKLYEPTAKYTDADPTTYQTRVDEQPTQNQNRDKWSVNASTNDNNNIYRYDFKQNYDYSAPNNDKNQNAYQNTYQNTYQNRYQNTYNTNTDTNTNTNTNTNYNQYQSNSNTTDYTSKYKTQLNQYNYQPTSNKYSSSTNNLYQYSYDNKYERQQQPYKPCLIIQQPAPTKNYQYNLQNKYDNQPIYQTNMNLDNANSASSRYREATQQYRQTLQQTQHSPGTSNRVNSILQDLRNPLKSPIQSRENVQEYSSPVQVQRIKSRVQNQTSAYKIQEQYADNSNTNSRKYVTNPTNQDTTTGYKQYFYEYSNPQNTQLESNKYTYKNNLQNESKFKNNLGNSYAQSYQSHQAIKQRNFQPKQNYNLDSGAYTFSTSNTNNYKFNLQTKDLKSSNTGTGAGNGYKFDFGADDQKLTRKYDFSASGGNNYLGDNKFGELNKYGGAGDAAYSFQSKSQFREYKNGELTSGYRVVEKDTNLGGYKKQEDLVSGQSYIQTSQKPADGYNKHYQLQLQGSNSNEEYNVQWDPQILADLQSNVHRN